MNLEKNSSSQNYISKLRVTQNDRHIEINSQTEIEKEISDFIVIYMMRKKLRMIQLKNS